jgi:hypothetical protein
MTLCMSGAAERLARDDDRVARRRMHAALDTTDHGFSKARRLRRSALRAGALTCTLRRTALRGATATCRASTLRLIGVSTAQRFHEPLANDEQKDQQKNLSHERSHHRTVQ